MSLIARFARINNADIDHVAIVIDTCGNSTKRVVSPGVSNGGNEVIVLRRSDVLVQFIEFESEAGVVLQGTSTHWGVYT